MPQALRSVLAIIGGFASMAVIVMVCTVVSMKALNLKSGQPTPVYLGINVAYSLLAALLGGFIAAKIAGKSPLAHGIALAALMLVLSALSFKTSAGGQPFAYRIFLVIGPPLAAIAGAELARRN